MARATGKKVEAPEVPPGVGYLWAIFTNLHRARGSGGFGPNPIGWQDILAYSTLMRIDFAPWEVEAIRALDDAFLETRSNEE